MFDHILYGGDYNPEQWPKEVWPEDARLMALANWNVATLPVFGWASLEPEEGVFDFDWLDEVVGYLESQGIGLCLATATASVPAWVDQKYPDILVVNRDGVKQRHGNRHTFCPNSPNFRRLAARLTREIAKRYGNHPMLRLWHISNEYGTYCYCDQCAEAFRVWLQARYGDLETLNRRWYLRFWGHQFTDWSQVEPPTTHGEGSVQALNIDWNRFMSESLLGCFLNEKAVIREYCPDVPVTTNFMGSPFYPLDYFRWAREMDVASWDNYPWPESTPGEVAFVHTIMRGLKQGQPFLLMEQSPSQQNWQPYNKLKPPRQLRLQSFQTLAHGGDAILYFQWRRGRGGFEKLHGAVMEHGGTPQNRVFQEVAEIGRELRELGARTLGHRVPARVALLFDWESWWALSFSSGPSKDFDYLRICREWFCALHSLGIPVEIAHPTHDLSRFDLILAPALTMFPDGLADRLRQRVLEGAWLVGTSFTCFVDETDTVFLEGAPGPLHDVFGVHVEETDAVLPGEANEIIGELGTFGAEVLCDRIQLKGAQTLATYGRDWYAGEPCFTVNLYGEGRGYYLATFPDEDGRRAILGRLCVERGIEGVLPGVPPKGVEATRRGDQMYLLNHAGRALETRLPEGRYQDLLTGEFFQGALVLNPRDVRILVPA